MLAGRKGNYEAWDDIGILKAALGRFLFDGAKRRLQAGHGYHL